jgi:hypothetical protein
MVNFLVSQPLANLQVNIAVTLVSNDAVLALEFY